MKLLRRVESWLPWPWRRGREAELERELRDHLDLETEEQREAGLSPGEAGYAARRALGNTVRIKEDVRMAWGLQWLETLLQDLRYGLRQLRRNPAFAAVTVLTLALGIGANTAIFSLIDAVMLKMLPVKDPQQLVILSSHRTKGGPGPTYSGYGMSLSYSGFERLRRQNEVFSSVMGFVPLGFGPASVTVNVNGQPSLAGGEMVSGNYFVGLGVPAILGRVLTDEDEDHAARVTVLSYGYWMRKFGRDPSVIGKTIGLGGEPFSIVGVTPPDFFGVEPGRAPDFWVPLADESGLTPWSVRAPKGQSLFTAKNWWWLMIIGRLKPGMSLPQAQASVDVWLRQSLTGEVGLSQADSQAFVSKVEPAGRGLDNLRGQFSQPLLILMGVVGLVLLIACANVAALLLARAQARRKEIAVRLALGASRARLVRQLLTESLNLAAAGGLCGMALAVWGAKVLLLLMSGGASLPLDIHLDWAVIGFAAGVSMLTGILFGLAPAVGSTRPSLSPELKESAGGAFQGSRGPRWRLGKSLVIAQVAFSLLLITGAGLFVRTLMNLEHENLGFDPHGVLLFGVNPKQNAYEGPRLVSLYDQLLQRIRALPGVRAASLSAYALISGWCNTSSIAVEGGQTKGEQGATVWWNLVGPDFLNTMRIRLLLGRGINDRDTLASPRVAVVNKSLARKFFRNLDPLGRRFTFGNTFNLNDAWEIVGVVEDAKYTGMRGEAPVTAYVPFSQEDELGPMHFEVRTAGEPTLLIPDVRRAVAEVDSNLALSDVRTQIQQIDEALIQEELFARLASFFGALALALGAVGLYGTMSYAVGRRTSEIGVRVALGAKRKQILKMVLREAFALVFIGIVLGLPVALAAARLVANRLYGLKASDPLTYSAAIGLLIAVAGLAAYLPARRASRVDAMTALRFE
jgi:predicted permease